MIAPVVEKLSKVSDDRISTYKVDTDAE